MNHIKDLSRHLNPFSDQFQTAIDDFKKQDLIVQVQVIGLSILAAVATFFVLGLGAIPVFRWAVQMLKPINQEDQVDLFQSKRLQRENEKKRADSMVGELPVCVINSHHCRFPEIDLEMDREWMREDLTNGSQLQELYSLMRTPTWNPPCFDVDRFVCSFNNGYGSTSLDMIKYIQQANFKQLKAMSAYFVSHEGYMIENDLTDRCFTFVELANKGVLSAWLARARELS